MVVALCDVFDDADTIAENPSHTPDELASTIVNLFVATNGDRTSDLLAHLMRTEIEDTGQWISPLVLFIASVIDNT